MRIYIRLYQDLGNYSTDTIELSSNRILVKDLKEKLFVKFHIDTSHQRLTTKLANNTLITLTNEFPLNFFYIKNDSIIYLEYIQRINKSEEIHKKLLYNNTANGKYFKRLGILKHITTPPSMGTIVESQIEYIDEKIRKDMLSNLNMVNQNNYHSKITIDQNNINLNKNNSLLPVVPPQASKSFALTQSSNNNLAQNQLNHSMIQINNSYDKEIEEKIRTNKVSEFRYLMDQYGYDVNKKWKNGWSPLHYVAYYGFSQMADDLINRYNADVNIITSDNWSPLHMASSKGHIDVVRVLIGNSKTNVNLNLQDNGTALHCACRKKHLQVVSLLAQVADTKIKDDHGYLPIDLTTDPNIKKFLYKKMYPELAQNRKKGIIKVASNNSINSNNDTGQNNINVNSNNNNSIKISPMTYKKYPFLKSLNNIPPQPNKTVGYCEKAGALFFKYNLRYLEIDPYVGSFKRFSEFKDYSMNPIEIIPLHDISDCKKIETPSVSSSEYFYMELTYDKKQIYRFKSAIVCEEWIDAINKAINYAKFWKGIQQTNATATSFLQEQKMDFVEIDYDDGNIYKVEQGYKIGLFGKDKEKNSKFLKKNTDSSISTNNTHSNSNNTITNISNNNNKITATNKINNDQITLIDPPEKKAPRKRRPNPNYHMICDEKLIEDSTKTKGITFESFEILDEIGAGAFGKVFLVKGKFDSEIYAMKCINKKYLIRQNQMRYAVSECNVLKRVNSPYILTLYYAFQTPDYLYMILDYCPGGDLNYHLIENLFEEDEAKFFIAELVLAIEELHSLDIIYRDLKPENILIAKDGNIKLADFGLCKENVMDNMVTRSICGSPAYLSPEMINNKGVGKAADIYGIGLVLYEMISGAPPFYTENTNSVTMMYQQITNNNLKLHEYFSDELSDLLLKLLNKDPKNRIGVTNKEEIKRHPFFNGIDWDKLARKELVPPINLYEIKCENEKGRNNKSNDFDEYVIECEKKNKGCFMDIDYNESNKDYHRIKKFTFVRPGSPSKRNDLINENNYNYSSKP